MQLHPLSFILGAAQYSHSLSGTAAEDYVSSAEKIISC